MGFWTSQRIENELAYGKPPVETWRPDRIGTACYELTLGAEAYITSAETRRVFEPTEQIRIPAGQFALLITEEVVRIPPNVLAFISIKASKKMTGLVNVSGFHVDPGFVGQLKFSVYNAGAEAVVLTPGEKMFPIWFYELDANDQRPYSGNHQQQRGISAADVMLLQGEVASPAELKRQLDDLRSSVGTWKAATIGLLTALLGAAVAVGFDNLFHKS